jgi:CheY-like chemotaxis protein
MTKKILIVEDDPILAFSLTLLVEEELGCTALNVPTVAQAWEIVGKGVDCALLDVEVTDGITYPLASFMLQNDIPVIFVSGSDRTKVPREIAHAPFLAKPVAETKLLETAREYL